MTPLTFTIYIFFFLMVISLITAAVFLVQDKGKEKRKRTLYALGARISCAVILMCLLSYGIFTGQLRSQAPWSYAEDSTSALESGQNKLSNTESSQ